MPKVLVVFDSDAASTAALADAVAEGASSVKFAEVEMRRINDFASRSVAEREVEMPRTDEAPARQYRALESVNALEEYDALIFGSSVHNGTMSAAMSGMFDQLGPLGMRGALLDKVGSVFASEAAPGDTQHMALGSMLISLIPFGMILVSPAYGMPTQSADSPGGAQSRTRAAAFDEVEIARKLGSRVAKVAEWVRHAKSHERGHSHQAHGHR